MTAEEHSIIGGLGSAVAEVIVKNCPVKMAMDRPEGHLRGIRKAG